MLRVLLLVLPLFLIAAEVRASISEMIFENLDIPQFALLPLRSNLIQEMNFNESGAATTFYDSSGTANNATCPVANCPTSGLGNALYRFVTFAGGNNYLKLTSSPAIGTTSPFSIVLNLKTGAISNGGTNDGSGTYFLDRFVANNPLVSLKAVGGAWYYQHRYDDGSGLGGVTGPAITQNVWHQIAMVRDFANLRIRLYLDGVQQGTPYTDSGGSFTVPQLVLANHQLLAGGLSGSFHRFQVYNKALSRGEILALFADFRNEILAAKRAESFSASAQIR